MTPKVCKRCLQPIVLKGKFCKKCYYRREAQRKGYRERELLTKPALFHVYVNGALGERIRAKAKKVNRPHSEVIRHILAEYFYKD